MAIGGGGCGRKVQVRYFHTDRLLVEVIVEVAVVVAVMAVEGGGCVRKVEVRYFHTDRLRGRNCGAVAVVAGAGGQLLLKVVGGCG